MSNFIRSLKRLEIEEKILNIGSTFALIGVFMPWFGGEWFGEVTTWSGFGFYTSFAGLLIFLSHTFVLALTVLPLLGYQVIKTSFRDTIRMIVGLECILLVIVVWSVLTNIAFDRAQMEIRFGLYLSLVGSIIVSLYAFLKLQQEKKRNVQEFFHHPEDGDADIQPIRGEESKNDDVGEDIPPPPPPPPPAKPEEPKLF
ncbi:hypothetical protein HOF56_02455 [Candidatus Peribacteria bacterium]|nr:hypothetical protein [Candidatus Peribacteria bacterium]MBT4021343.1 hypothetical protein [Candidatus Peribacteria bacterium]MBT4241196.1 hypothetical protein [Candidatus Peribacteria bacterium]MBT4474221.1 hypothetical protein [Candidatus Peribacteria bacterium]